MQHARSPAARVRMLQSLYMKHYEAKTFNLPPLTGLSPQQVQVHLALYEGYVKHVNLIMDKLAALRAQGADENAYLMAELRRRFAFEFDGMRMHEYYFEQFESGAAALDESSALAAAATEKYGSPAGLVAHLKELAGTRGIGWVVAYYDPRIKSLHSVFVNDHEIGQLAGLPVVIALDLWEHAFMVDYKPSEKKTYVDVCLENMNWQVAQERFNAAA